MYSCCLTISQNSLKNLFGKVFFFFFFQILAQIKMTHIKNQLFDRHYETVQPLLFFIIYASNTSEKTNPYKVIIFKKKQKQTNKQKEKKETARFISVNVHFIISHSSFNEHFILKR